MTHYLAYEALTSRDIGIGGVYRFFGAQKSCAEVWDNVADRLCHVQGFLDSAARRGHSSNDYVDDVLTVKIVVDGEEEARSLLESFRELTFDPKLLRSIDVPFYPKGKRCHSLSLALLFISKGSFFVFGAGPFPVLIFSLFHMLRPSCLHGGSRYRQNSRLFY